MVSKENKTEVELERVLNSFVKLDPKNSDELGNSLKKTGMLAKIKELSERGDIADALYKIISKRPEFAAFVGALKSPTANLSSEDGKLSVIRLFFHFEASKNEKLAKELQHYLKTDFVRDGKLYKPWLLVGLLVYCRRAEYPKSRLLWDEKKQEPYFYVKELKAVSGIKATTPKPLSDALIESFNKGDDRAFKADLQKADPATLEDVFLRLYIDKIYTNDNYSKYIKSPGRKAYADLTKGDFLKIWKNAATDREAMNDMKGKYKGSIINSTREWLGLTSMLTPKVTPELLEKVFWTLAPKTATQPKKTQPVLPGTVPW
ncbi:MAG: hypothetical protein QW171_03235 [Candidatus Bilamarchaeaceae archaeon]